MNLVHTMDIGEAVEYSEDARYFTFTYAPWKTLTEADFPLHLAGYRGEEERVKQLLSDGENVNRATWDNVTPLHNACLAGRINCVTILLNAGATIDARNIDGSTPLCDACNNGSVQVVRLLLERGASPNPKLCYTQPLHEAVLRDHVEIVEMLILYGAKLNPNDLHFGPPLHVAALKTHVESARILLRYGADVNAAKMHATSLHLAARQDSHEMLELLLDAGADIYARDNQGRVAKQLCHCWNQARQLLDFFESNPFTLMHWCRLAIRKYLTPSRLNKLTELKLPFRLQKYMEFRIK